MTSLNITPVTKEEYLCAVPKEIKEKIKNIISYLQNRTLTVAEAAINKSYNDICMQAGRMISLSTVKAGIGEYPIGLGAVPTMNIKVKNFDLETLTGAQRAHVVKLGAVKDKTPKISSKYIDEVYSLGRVFDVTEMEPIKVNYDEVTNEFECWDGEHRLILMILYGIDMTPAYVCQGLSGEEVARKFMEQNNRRVPVRSIEKIAAGIVADKNGPEAILHRVCEEKGVTLCNIQIPNKDIMSNFKTAQQIVSSYGEEGLKFALDFILESFPNYDKRFQRRFMELAKLVYAYNFKEKKVAELKSFIISFSNPEDFIRFCAKRAEVNEDTCLRNEKVSKQVMCDYALSFLNA